MAVAVSPHAVSDFDLTTLTALTSVTDLNRLLREAFARERGIDAELEELLSRRESVEGSLLGLRSSTAEALEGCQVEAEQLTASVQATSELAERVSRKVRQLDLEQGRVQDTLDRIGVIVDRSTALEGIRGALDRGDFETAAGHVASFLELRGRGGPGPADAAERRQAQQQEKVLLEEQAKLQTAVRERAEAARGERDHTAVLRFVRLYTPLGARDEGLRFFVEYLQELVSERAREDYSALVENAEREDTSFGATLAALFRDITAALAENEAFLTEAFGRAALLDAAVGLAATCDQHGTRVLQRYTAARRLPQLVQQVAGQARGRAEGAPGPAAVDPRQVEGPLEEMLGLCQTGGDFAAWLLAAMAAAVAPAPLGPGREAELRGGPFGQALRELLAYYVAIEEFYLEESLRKAVRIEEWREGSLTSSVVDDALFIAQQCGQRGVATRNAQAACAVLGGVNARLAAEVRPALEARWRGSVGRVAAAARLHLADPEAAPPGDAAQALVPLNNLHTGAEYVGKLRGALEAAAGEHFAGPADRERLRSVTADLAKTAADLRAAAGAAAGQAADALRPLLNPALEALRGASYELDEAGYEAAQREDSWVQDLLGVLIPLVLWLAQLLTPANNAALLSHLLEKVVAQVEVRVKVKAFSQLGGLQLDRDARALLGALSEAAQQSCRDKFSSLSQRGMLLSLESVGELMDYWEEGVTAGTWRLTPAEVREVLRQRVDFAPEDIAALPLGDRFL